MECYLVAAAIFAVLVLSYPVSKRITFLSAGTKHFIYMGVMFLLVAYWIMHCFAQNLESNQNRRNKVTNAIIDIM